MHAKLHAREKNMQCKSKSFPWIMPNGIFSRESFVGIYLSTNPSPQDPPNLLLAQINRPIKMPGGIFQKSLPADQI